MLRSCFKKYVPSGIRKSLINMSRGGAANALCMINEKRRAEGKNEINFEKISWEEPDWKDFSGKAFHFVHEKYYGKAAVAMSVGEIIKNIATEMQGKTFSLEDTFDKVNEILERKGVIKKRKKVVGKKLPGKIRYDRHKKVVIECFEEYVPEEIHKSLKNMARMGVILFWEIINKKRREKKQNEIDVTEIDWTASQWLVFAEKNFLFLDEKYCQVIDLVYTRKNCVEIMEKVGALLKNDKELLDAVSNDKSMFFNRIPGMDNKKTSNFSTSNIDIEKTSENELMMWAKIPIQTDVSSGISGVLEDDTDEIKIKPAKQQIQEELIKFEKYVPFGVGLLLFNKAVRGRSN